MTYPRPLPLVPLQAHAVALDGLPGRIAHELARRNWDVPGVEVVFGRKGTGMAQRRVLSAIQTADVMVQFTNYGELLRVGGAGCELLVSWSVDGSWSLRFAAYTGADWEVDKQAFLNERSKNHGAREGHVPYLNYEGACDCPNLDGAIFTVTDATLMAAFQGDREGLRNALHEHDREVPPLLVYTGDSYGTEYLPGPDDPLIYRTADVVATLQAELAKLLHTIAATPVPAEQIDIFAEKRRPWPVELGPLFTFGSQADVERIAAGQRDPLALDGSERYALHPHDPTFLSGCYGLPDYPTAVDDGVIRCGMGSVAAETPLYTLTIPGSAPQDDEHYVIHVQPTSANGIYIADYAARGLPEQWGAIEEGDKRVIADRGVLDTLVPITKYRGGYALPVVVITRELDFHEVEVVSGPWPQQPPPSRLPRWLRWLGSSSQTQLTA